MKTPVIQNRIVNLTTIGLAIPSKWVLIIEWIATKKNYIKIAVNKDDERNPESMTFEFNLLLKYRYGVITHSELMW